MGIAGIALVLTHCHSPVRTYPHRFSNREFAAENVSDMEEWIMRLEDCISRADAELKTPPRKANFSPGNRKDREKEKEKEKEMYKDREREREKVKDRAKDREREKDKGRERGRGDILTTTDSNTETVRSSVMCSLPVPSLIAE
jgi:hypothetical protein